MKLIREGRMGPPKSFKTGAVVGTYPKPMLVLSFDEGGLDVIPSKTMPRNNDLVQFDCVAEDIVWIKPTEITTALAKPESEQPKITAIDFCDSRVKQTDLAFKVTGNSEPYSMVMSVINALVTADGRTTRSSLPWKTIVFDPVTGFSDIVLLLIAANQPNSLADARQWASMIGSKVQQVVGVLTSLPAHIVILMHSQYEKNELMGSIVELPSIYSGYRDKIGAYLSQFLYATKTAGKPVVWTTDQMFVRGIGCRWPQGLPPICAPDFRSIYGKELGL